MVKAEIKTGDVRGEFVGREERRGREVKLGPVLEDLVLKSLGKPLPPDLDAAVLQYAIQRVDVHLHRSSRQSDPFTPVEDAVL